MINIHSKKNLAYIIERINHLEFYIPIIEKNLIKNKNHIIFYPLNSVQGTKAYLSLEMATFKKINNKLNVQGYENFSHLKKLIIKNNIEIFISFKSKAYFDLAGLKIKNILLQMNLDTFITNTKRDFIKSDVIIIYSQFWEKFYLKIFGVEHYKKTKSKIRLLGSPKYRIKLASKNILKKKYNLDLNKKYLLILPPNFKTIKSIWNIIFQIDNKFLRLIFIIFLKIFRFKITNETKKIIQNSITEKKLTNSIRKFAEKNNLNIIIKGRSKSKIRKIWTKIADHIFYDESYYPSTISELIKCSDLCITSYSTVVFDIINQSLPTLNLIRPSPYEDELFKNKIYNVDILQYHKLLRESNFSPFTSSDIVKNISIQHFIKKYDKLSFYNKKISKNNKIFFNGI